MISFLLLLLSCDGPSFEPYKGKRTNIEAAGTALLQEYPGSSISLTDATDTRLFFTMIKTDGTLYEVVMSSTPPRVKSIECINCVRLSTLSCLKP